MKYADTSIFQRLIHIATGSSILASANVINAVIILCSIPFIVRGIGMTGYGVIVLVQAFALTLVRLFDGQAWQVYVRLIGLGYDRAAAFAVGIKLDIMALIGLLLAMLSAQRFMQYWQQPISFDVAALFALSIVNQVTFSWVGALRLANRFAALAWTILLPSCCRLIFLILLKNTLTLQTIAWIYAISELLRFLFTAYLGWSCLKIKIQQAFNRSVLAWHAVRHFTFWNWLMNLVDLPVQYVDSLLIGKLLSVELVGVYGIIKRVASVCSHISAPLYQVIFPEFTRLIAVQSFTLCRQLLWHCAWIMLGLGSIIMTILYYFYSVWMPWIALSTKHVSILFLFLGIQVAAVAFTAVHPLMNALGLARSGFYIVLINNLIFLGLLFLLGSDYGLYGVMSAMGTQFALVIVMKLVCVEYILAKRKT